MPVLRGRRERPKPRYGMIFLAAVVLVGLLVVARLVKARFAWWKEAAVEGRAAEAGRPARDTAEEGDP